MAYFIPCKSTNDALEIASFFLKEIVKIHGLPLTILSNNDEKFIGHFWRTLLNKLGTYLSFSSTYNPKTNGHIEVVNKSLGFRLGFLIKQYGHKWEPVLPQENFAFNETINRSIGNILFQIVYGKNPRGILELSKLPSNTLVSSHGEDFVESMKEIHDSVRMELEKSSKKYKQDKEKNRRDVQFQGGDLVWVYLKKERLPKKKHTKLLMKKVGPC